MPTKIIYVTDQQPPVWATCSHWGLHRLPLRKSGRIPMQKGAEVPMLIFCDELQDELEKPWW